MKTKRYIKVGDMVWWRIFPDRVIKCRVDSFNTGGRVVLIDGDDGVRNGLLYDCKLIIPRKKKAKKDRLVNIGFRGSQEMKRQIKEKAKKLDTSEAKLLRLFVRSGLLNA